MAAALEPLTTKQMAQKSLQANKDHQFALKAYIERLEAELQTVDKLLSSAETVDNEEEPELDVGGFILVPGSKKACGPLRANVLFSEDSPFHEDADKRSRYLSFTCIHPMKAKELDVLAEAVRTENSRKHAFEAQRRGEEPFLAPNRLQADIETNTEGLDWERIATKVSSVSSTPRTARECEIRWVGDRHPLINHTSWSQNELARLKTLVPDPQEGHVNWVDIAKELGTHRTPIDCMRHSLHRKHHWDTQSDNRLLDVVKVYGTDNWNLVAKHVSESATAQQCSSRFMRTLDPTLKRGAWTTEEDSQLRLAVEVYGNSWMEIAAVIPGRNNEQCRDRWIDRINPNLVKGKWSKEEDEKLVEAVKIVGRKWGLVSERMGNGRTDKVCRVRYEALKKREQTGPAVGSSTAAPDRCGEEHQGGLSTPKPRPPARKRKSAVTLPESSNGDSHPPPVQSRPKPRPLTKTNDREKEVTDPVINTDQSPSEAVNIAQSAPPPRPTPRPRTRSKGKDKEVVAEDGSSMEIEAEPDDRVADEGMLPTARGHVQDPSLRDHEADMTLEGATVTKKTRGGGRGKAQEKTSTLSITTAKRSKKRAGSEDGEPDALRTKKQKVAVAKNALLGADVGESATTVKATPPVRLDLQDVGPRDAVEPGPSRTTDEHPLNVDVPPRVELAATPPEPVLATTSISLATTSTTSTPAEGKAAKERATTEAVGPTRRQPARGTAAVVEDVREASPALSELTELTEDED